VGFTKWKRGHRHWSGRSFDYAPPSSSNQRGARLRTPVYASDPSNKESGAASPIATKGREHRPPESWKDGRKLLVELGASARKGPSCKHTSLLEDRKQVGRFLTFETWTDQAAIEAHMTTPAIKAAGPNLEPILAKLFTRQFLKMVSDG
jgi:quinol monooxygenase YgiN